MLAKFVAAWLNSIIIFLALLTVAIAIAVGWFGAYSAWPARHIAKATIPIAAVQGNIAQSIKWDPGTLPRSVAAYTQLSKTLAPLHPALVVWPETVITTDLNDNAANWNLAGMSPGDRRRFQAYFHVNASLIQ